ncbi:ATP-binding cassette domain-containing protein [Nonomuraea dietziae]|uniref:ATP-binding cassette domain-containing protein n=1 Tax=Nonomuraea dietziae TaxID=65515 RepID=UPI0036079722
MTTLARTVEVSKRYGEVNALDGVSLEIEAGRLVGLLGPNGAGKSTLVNLFVGLRKPTKGLVELLGGNPSDPAYGRASA